MFTKDFQKCACEGDTITCTVGKFDVTARIANDDCQDAPWDREDGHGAVTQWVRRGKNAGERVLAKDRDSYRYYDFAGAVVLAKKDGWGFKGSAESGITKAQIAERAAEEDFEALKAWCNDEWRYVGIVLSVSRNSVVLDDHAASLWSIDCNHPSGDNSYLREVANELLPEALASAETRRKQLTA